MPKWQLDYTLEVLNYLEDNGQYAGDIRQGLRMLKHIDDGMPPEGALVMRDFIYWYTVFHLVVYRKVGNKLTIIAVEPE